ncbi:MAG TPA: secretin N-terminal domain-containing protein [Longimicrobiales bacterium]
MRLRSLFLAFVLSTAAVCAGVAPIYAQEQQGRGVERSAEGVSLDFQDADLRVVIATLAQVAGLNVVFSDLPERTVTLRTSRPVPPSEVRGYLESLVRAQGLEMTEENGLVRIAGSPTTAVADAEARRGTTPQRVARQAQVQLFVHPLRHARAEQLAQTISALFGVSSVAAAEREEGPRSLTEELRMQREAPFAPPQPEQPRAPGQAGGGEQGAGLAAGLVGPVTIVPDPRTNALLIRALPEDYETLRQAIQALDARPLQVLIEVLIAEVRRNSQRGLGVSLLVPDNHDSETGVTIGGELVGSGAGDLTISALGVGAVRAEVLLSALASDADVTILSRPVILAQNNQEARILVGSQRPFVQLFRALPTDEAVRDQLVAYRDVGTQLTIRPTINPDGYVNLRVLQEVSVATSETQFNAPVISTREAETELLVKDGHTAVIGGLMDRQRDDTRGGVPILKDIPVLGALFRSTLERRDVTELFLFITPHVIATDEDLERATRGVRDATDRLRRRLPDPLPLLPDTLFPPDHLAPDTTVRVQDVQRADTAQADEERRRPRIIRQRVVPPGRDPPDSGEEGP